MSLSQTISLPAVDPVLQKAFWMRMLHGAVAPPDLHVKWSREAATLPGYVSVTEHVPTRASNNGSSAGTFLLEADCLCATLLAIYKYCGRRDLLVGLGAEHTPAGKSMEDSLLPLRFALSQQPSVNQMRASLVSLIRNMRDNGGVRSASLRWQPSVPAGPDGWPKLNVAVLPNWSGGPLPLAPNRGLVIAFSGDSASITLCGNFDQRHFDQQGAAGFLAEVGAMTKLVLDNRPILIAAVGEVSAQAAAEKEQRAEEEVVVWSEETARRLAAGSEILAAGAELQNPGALLRALQQRRPAVVEFTPYIMAELLEHAASLDFEARCFANLRYVVVCGEPIPVSLLNEWLAAYPHVPVVQVLGAGYGRPAVIMRKPVGTEHLLAPIFRKDCYRVEARAEVHIAVHIEVRTGGKSAPAGVPGEIWLKETDNSVVSIDAAAEIANENASPWRNSGECGKYLPGEGIEWLGPVAELPLGQNSMNRIHLEAVLNAHPSIRYCAVVSARDDGADSRLLASIVCKRGAMPATSELDEYVRGRLGVDFDFEIRYAESLPLLVDGRIDREALRKTPEEDGSPRNAVDEVLAALWTQVLKVSRVGIHDDFFALGGHSVLAMQLTARIRRIFQTEISLRAVFEAPSIANITDMLIASEKSPGQAEKLARFWQRTSTMSPEELKQLLVKAQAQSQA